MGQRLDLHAYLEFLLGSDQVHFQPPVNVEMLYPAIVYERDYAESEFADNVPYRITKRYSVTVIDRNPDSEIPDKVLSMPSCRFNRHFKANQLNHDVFTLYF